MANLDPIGSISIGGGKPQQQIHPPLIPGHSANHAIQVILTITIVCLLGALPSVSHASNNESTIGIQSLQDLHGRPPSTLVSLPYHPLLTAQELEGYLSQLEGTIPPWHQLSSQDINKQSERLLQFNRQRDEQREQKHSIAHQPIAFVWAGELREYNEEYQGFQIALGPEIMPTAWGLVRFKPRDIPNFMIATVSPEQKASILNNSQAPASKDIGILFMGTLVEGESIMYAFSHDGDHEGMILPVVNITAIQYFIK